MIKINRDEMEYLVSNGLKFGNEGSLHKYPANHGKWYYLTEGRKEKQMLFDYRKSRTVETHSLGKRK